VIQSPNVSTQKSQTLLHENFKKSSYFMMMGKIEYCSLLK
jgi:hypothetical protein